MKRKAIEPAGNQISPLPHLCKTEIMVYEAITSESKLESNQNLVKQVATITKLSELQVRAAILLLLQKNVIFSDEIIDTDI
ncbi:MAG: hypothetical protein K0S39_2218 [Paenibacillus sp.]|nr:hypothetical protein [Paenibacillus sp.]